MEKIILSGNEAIARGAVEAGVEVGTGYPGTPSSEILESLAAAENVRCEWSVNEKAALEVGLGASFTGARVLVTMKHVGVNAAADPLFTSAYTGVKGGLVIVTADDPGMHSSQNEQDNRYYAESAGIPMLEPSDSSEAREFTKLAFEISEQFDTPVFLRTTTRVSHSKSLVEVNRLEKKTLKKHTFEKDPEKYVMIPAFARVRHREAVRRMEKIKKYADCLDINFIEQGEKAIGIITSGICYQYVKEVFPDASILKLGMVYPLPEEIISGFCRRVERVIIVEELGPFIEKHIKQMGIRAAGKEMFPLTGELGPDMIKRKISKDSNENKMSTRFKLPSRPPALCPGCPHSKLFSVLKKSGVTVAGDIGCYTLGALPPYNAVHTCIDMGSGITVAQGIEMGMGDSYDHETVALIGDSTFAHSGITGLLNAAYNRHAAMIIVLDNGTTAMTGMQPNPFTGRTLKGECSSIPDYTLLGLAFGMKEENIKTVDSNNEKQIETAFENLRGKKELSLLVVKGACVIHSRKKTVRNKGKAHE